MMATKTSQSKKYLYAMVEGHEAALVKIDLIGTISNTIASHSCSAQ